MKTGEPASAGGRLAALHGLGPRTAAFSIAVVAASAVTLGLLAVSVQRQSAAARLATRSEEAIAVAHALEKQIVDVESSERGFVVTRDKSYLRPYRQALQMEPGQMSALMDLVYGDTAHENLVAGLSIAIDDYIHGWAIPAVALASSDLGEARKQFTTGQGRTMINDIEARFSGLVAAEQVRAGDARGDAARVARLALDVTLGGLLVAVLLAVAFFLFLRRSVLIPLRGIVGAMRRASQGELSTRTALDGAAEILQLQRGFNAMAEGIERHRDGIVAEKTKVERLFEFSEALAAQNDLTAAGELVLDRLVGVTSADLAALYTTAEASEGSLRLLAVRGFDRDTLPADISSRSGPAGAALEQRRLIHARPDQGGILASALTALSPPCHELYIPLLQGHRVVGVVVVGRLREEPFSPEDEVLATHLADPSTMALAQLMAYTEALALASINRTLIDSALDGIRLIDLDGTILAENRQMTRLVEGVAGIAGSTSHWEQAEPLASLTTDPASFLTAFEELRRNSSAVEDHEFELADTGQIFRRFTAPVRDGAGVQTGRIITLRDITNERQHQRIKDEFVATVTHELRTPLTSITGYIELLLDEDVGALTTDQRHFLEVVKRNSERLLRLVSDLLFVSRVEAGMLDLDLREASLDPLVAEAFEAARPAAEAQDLRLALSLGGLPELVADGPRLAQLVDNLLSNAVKFTPPGGRVSVSTALEDGRAVLTVADTGLGIPDAEKERLFQRFFRASTATDKLIAGTGLGLSISKAIVEGHGGSITVTDTPGGGTTFKVELPLVAAPAKRAA